MISRLTFGGRDSGGDSGGVNSVTQTILFGLAEPGDLGRFSDLISKGIPVETAQDKKIIDNFEAMTVTLRAENNGQLLFTLFTDDNSKPNEEQKQDSAVLTVTLG